MTTITAVEAEFNTELAQSSIKGAMKDAGASSRDLWQVPIDKIKIIDGLNPRIMTESYKAHIRALADSIKSEGFYQDQPLAGYTAAEGDDRVVYIYSGHSRLLAAKLAISEGIDPFPLPITVSQNGLSMQDITVALIRGNGGKPLTPYEAAIVCTRLAKYGFTTSEVAKRVGFSEQHVKNLLTLMSAPLKLREMVAHEIVAASMAIEMIAEYGGDALAKIEAAVSKANSEGKTRVTNKHVAGASYKKFITRSAPIMVVALTTIQADPGFAGLAPETQAQLLELMEEIKSNKDEGDVKDARQNPLFEDASKAAA